MAMAKRSRLIASLTYRLFPKKSMQMLAGCLETIQRDGKTLDEALARYPGYEQLLRPDLEAQLPALDWLDGARNSLAPGPEFVVQSRRRLLQRLEPRRQPWYRRLDGYTLNYTRAQLALRVALVLLLLVSGWYSFDRAMQAASTSIPGDVFYPLKTGAEGARLLFATTTTQKAQLHTEFARQRLMELQSLVFEGRYEPIPQTVTRYEKHVNAALQAVLSVSGRDVEAAGELARAYQQATIPQIDLVLMLSGSAPGTAYSQFERVRLSSQHSDFELQNLLPASSG